MNKWKFNVNITWENNVPISVTVTKEEVQRETPVEMEG